MDPLLAANQLATFVQLFALLMGERKSTKQMNHQDFIEWLAHHRHEELKNFISNTAAVQAEVDTILRADHAKILAKLDTVSTGLAALTSQIPEFRKLSLTIAPKSALSEQCISILRQLVNSESSEFCALNIRNEVELHLNKGGLITISDKRFLEDDLNQLVYMELLTYQKSITGRERNYLITRFAQRLVNSIDRQ